MFDTNIPLYNQIKLKLDNIFNIAIFDMVKTGNPIIDATITTFLLSALMYLYQYVNDNIVVNYYNPSYWSGITNFDIRYFYCKRYSVTYYGKTSIKTTQWGQTVHTKLFSERFKALLNYIISNIQSNDNILSIKETPDFKRNEDENESLSTNYSVDRPRMNYIVTQKKHFLISNEHEIYVNVTINNENDGDDDGKNKSKIETISIELFSYKCGMHTMLQFVEHITTEYTKSLQNDRLFKKFVYSLTNVNQKNDDCEEKTTCDMWMEVLFSSTRSFDNIFFDGKENFLKKLNFFINNKEWYFEHGIPYSFGIGLHGPPGTGKTSLIKSVAKLTGRHIVIISLKMVKSKQLLDSLFFENRYSNDNVKGSIGFDKKIIVFEDIDCIGDIVKDREKINKKNSDKASINLLSKINSGEFLENVLSCDKGELSFTKDTITDPITLDDILNLWDGIRETPGRMMIITSNHYKELDPALTRPGRIDLTCELSYASRNLISEMYSCYFKEPIDKNKLNKINDRFYTPAEIVNIYINSNSNPAEFVERLMKNEHV